MVGRQTQSYVQGCDGIAVTVHTDREVDRILSQRISSKVPLPPEICLSDGYSASQFFAHRLFYELMGVGDHPVITMLERYATDINMSRVLNRASHLDRMSHYAAWLGNEQVRVIDLGDTILRDESEGSDIDVEEHEVTDIHPDDRWMI